ncbi:hypothetical protein AgCh_018282 [Apium graveolens]
MTMDLALAKGHLHNMGKMVEEIEWRLKNSLEDVYFGKRNGVHLATPAELLQMRFIDNRDACIGGIRLESFEAVISISVKTSRIPSEIGYIW